MTINAAAEQFYRATRARHITAIRMLTADAQVNLTRLTDRLDAGSPLRDFGLPAHMAELAQRISTVAALDELYQVTIDKEQASGR